jgi:lipopolysaccharide export system permease protein
MKLLGLRLKRHVFAKEVIIYDPHYEEDARKLAVISDEVTHYAHEHKLVSPPNIIKVFFKYEPDHEIERIVPELEEVIDDLSNVNLNKRLHSKEKKKILTELNHYPVVSVKAHTRPFERRWLNILAAVVLPVGICLYIRMWSFRLRLYRDLKTIKQTNGEIIAAIKSMGYGTSNDGDAATSTIYNKV